MIKFIPVTILKRNKKIFFKLNTCCNYTSDKKKVTDNQCICKYCREGNFTKLNMLHRVHVSTTGIKTTAYTTGDDQNDKENYNAMKKNSKERKLTNEGNEEKERDEKTGEMSNDNIKEINGKHEMEKNLEGILSEEFGYKYDKHEPTMFGDWSHNCRVTDF
ncbi:conserved Plasmodium protein, unknown function [Plasmodium ovale wallikeri]|uniref:Succinate dehydrogenase assembly factor 4, mitochondrial n=2 Tax=Plasmodium ovale TaxID=36330 RepID=A0A1A8ZX93_PLAOA|nr:conserved Plasmodium protein, unknown function [Plasmodium ovale wallikeri]SBT48948.1 conserved Plasmodium protein, unknown function [Plasmodium ovale wallikeri]SBT82492.1 conserved Plasmodium protein, unknown function [Plasmodium ovale]